MKQVPVTYAQRQARWLPPNEGRKRQTESIIAMNNELAQEEELINSELLKLPMPPCNFRQIQKGAS